LLSKPANRNESFRDERQFGLLVGAVFALIGFWWFYHNKFESVAAGLVVAGTALMLLGALFPRVLVAPNRGWMSIAKVLSHVSTTLILGVVYVSAVTPIGLIKKLQGWDPLQRRGDSRPTYWKDYTGRQGDRRHYEKMF
jgi:hypothetical protein